jgi:phosphate starvation-inducible PhoH-like protein
MARKEKYSEPESKAYILPNITQKILVQSIINNSITLVSGSPGTGKTLFSIQTLYKLLKSHQINQILIVRLILENRYENIGALPGTEKDKLMPYLMPIIDNLELFLPQGEIDYLINKDLIKVVPISFLRGRTFSNKGIIVEESQNLNEHEIMTTATRLGEGSRMIFNGDDSQHDLDCRFGIHYLTQLFTDIEGIGIVKFNNDNISRHPLIEKILARQKEIKEKNAIKNT